MNSTYLASLFFVTQLHTKANTSKLTSACRHYQGSDDLTLHDADPVFYPVPFEDEHQQTDEAKSLLQYSYGHGHTVTVTVTVKVTVTVTVTVTGYLF